MKVSTPHLQEKKQRVSLAIKEEKEKEGDSLVAAPHLGLLLLDHLLRALDKGLGDLQVGIDEVVTLDELAGLGVDCRDGELGAAEGDGTLKALRDPFLNEIHKVLVGEILLALLDFEDHVLPQKAPVLWVVKTLVHIPVGVGAVKRLVLSLRSHRDGGAQDKGVLLSALLQVLAHGVLHRLHD